ncbi:hypothetical protein F2Q69_00048214 [Brassica cretica]|uniref:Uncharacterized protein n=1 Tax=Brassica cretica TaxID=69181 RepID=A0A8S9PKN5_BRACR|nr:hypothetical protein F2Q69_00048214 [Brassica cretica]
MSGNTKEKIALRNNAGKKTPAATAPMANAYANATPRDSLASALIPLGHVRVGNQPATDSARALYRAS